MGVTSIGSRFTANAGDVHRELSALRRKKALFQLSLEGTNGIALTSAPDEFIIAASYEDDGYINEPLRAKIVAMDKLGSHEVVPFEGNTPEELVDAMIAAWQERFPASV